MYFSEMRLLSMAKENWKITLKESIDKYEVEMLRKSR
jgi:hypothetical protein